MPTTGDPRRHDQAHLSHADDLRFRSWALDVVAVLRPDDKVRDDADDRQFAGGLRVCKRNGAWYDHAAGKGGWSLLPLLQLLKNCTAADAAVWAKQWLASHPGFGSCNGEDGADDDDSDDRSVAATEAKIERAKECMAALVPLVEGTPGYAYLHSRGLTAPYPEGIQWLPPNTIRWGEGAVASTLYANGVAVGVQVTHVAPDGTKSMIEPVRRTFLLEKSERARAATFGHMPDPASLVALAKEKKPAILISEGTEDFLSLLQALSENIAVGIPGIGTLSRLTVAKGACIVVCRDGDQPESAASQGLIRGLDHLLLQGADVRVTAPEEGTDNNDILQRDGVDALQALVAAAVPAELSLDGEAKRCARMKTGDYDRIRKDVARRLGVRVGTLDGYIAAARRNETKAADTPPAAPTWPGDINLREALDAALVQLKKYIIAPEPSLAVCAVWATTTHLARNDTVRLSRAVILKLQSRAPGSGKSTTCEVLGELCPDAATSDGGIVRSTYTPSSLKREFQEAAEAGRGRPTLILDEADQNIKADGDLLPFLNGCTRRRSANASYSVPTDDGGWKSHTINYFGPVLLAGIDSSPPQIEDRSITVLLQRETLDSLPQELPDETPVELEELRRHFAAWAAARTERLTDPATPDWLRRRAGRVARSWLQLLAVATEAGGPWPALIEQAATEVFNTEREPTQLERLLTSIRKLFDTRRADLEQAKEKGNGSAHPWGRDDGSSAPRARKATCHHHGRGHQ